MKYGSFSSSREYQAVDLQSAYRFSADVSLNAQWTLQLENDGNFEGESLNNPAVPSLIADYPEVYVPERLKQKDWID